MANPELDDLLKALGSPTVQFAEEIWNQSIDEHDHVEHALMVLSNKFENPAEALLGAHYLLRFTPNKLPLLWADNLSKAIAGVADAPVIAAWLRLLSGGSQYLNTDRVEEEVDELFEMALRCPRTLFARTRRLLAEGLRLQSNRRWQNEVVQSTRTNPSNYLNYGAHAGGLEAFWGTGPFSPGPAPVDSTLPCLDVASVFMDGSTFTEEPRKLEKSRASVNEKQAKRSKAETIRPAATGTRPNRPVDLPRIYRAPIPAPVILPLKDRILQSALDARQHLADLEQRLQREIRDEEPTIREPEAQRLLRRAQADLREQRQLLAMVTPGTLNDTAETSMLLGKMSAINVSLSQHLPALQSIQRYAMLAAKVQDSIAKFTELLASLAARGFSGGK